MRRTLLPICLVAFLAVPSHAADITWDGGAGTTDWMTAHNWSGDMLPTGTDNAVVSTAASLTLTGPAAVAELRFEGAGIPSALTISGGGILANTLGMVGNAAGSSGTVTVTGSGSQWTNSGLLRLGNPGTPTTPPTRNRRPAKTRPTATDAADCWP